MSLQFAHQGMYFNRIAATKGQKDEFAIARFGNEAERCLKMLEARTWKPLTLELKMCVVTPHLHKRFYTDTV